MLQEKWPEWLDPAIVRFTVRTSNCLKAAGLYNDPGELTSLTYGELLRISNMGVKSAIEFAVTAEVAVRNAKPPESWSGAADAHPHVERTIEIERIAALLQTIEDAEWPQQVSRDDPRFFSLLSDRPSTLAEYIDSFLGSSTHPLAEWSALEDTVRNVAERVTQIRQLTLDAALHDLLEHASSLEPKRFRALAARLGVSGDRPLTLQEAGDMVGVTRERIRQLERRALNRLPSDHVVFLPQLDASLELLASKAPITTKMAEKLLASNGISSRPFSIVALMELALLFRRTVPFEIVTRNDETCIVTGSVQRYANAIFRIARYQAGASGVTNVELVREELASNYGETVPDTGELTKFLRSFDAFVFLNSQWFWCSANTRNRVCNIARRVLSVASPVTVSSLHEAVRRYLGYRGTRGTSGRELTIAPEVVFAEFFKAHPEFDVGDGGYVRCHKTLDRRKELGDAEQVLVDVLNTSPAGILDRSSLVRQCLSRGVNEATVNTYLTYSPILLHYGLDVWGLRGRQVDPAALNAMREANAARPKERRVLDYGWTDEGTLWLCARLPEHYGSFVVGIPTAITRYLEGEKFRAYTMDGDSIGTIVVGQRGTSWGYAKFLRQNPGQGGKVLRVEFDLESRTAFLSMVDDYK